jgi:hypothetical protein
VISVICGTCGGVGILSGIEVCPECGFDSRTGRQLSRQDISKLIPEIEKKGIPKSYVGVNWTPGVFWAAHSGMKGNKLVELFLSQMEKVHTVFASGKLPQRSAIFIAPSHYSKLTWAYSCIQHALKAGYSVAPILDTSEIKRLFVLSSESLNFRLNGLNYEEYVDSDVCFFTVVKNEFRRNSFSVVQDLLDKRNRRGLDTWGISRFSMAEISSWDKTGDFSKLMVQYPEDNLCKIPAIISCL